MNLIKTILERIRKNKKPYEPDVEVNLAPALKWFKRKQKAKQPIRF